MDEGRSMMEGGEGGGDDGVEVKYEGRGKGTVSELGIYSKRTGG